MNKIYALLAIVGIAALASRLHARPDEEETSRVREALVASACALLADAEAAPHNLYAFMSSGWVALDDGGARIDPDAPDNPGTAAFLLEQAGLDLLGDPLYSADGYLVARAYDSAFLRWFAAAIPGPDSPCAGMTAKRVYRKWGGAYLRAIGAALIHVVRAGLHKHPRAVARELDGGEVHGRHSCEEAADDFADALDAGVRYLAKAGPLTAEGSVMLWCRRIYADHRTDKSDSKSSLALVGRAVMKTLRAYDPAFTAAHGDEIATVIKSLR